MSPSMSSTTVRVWALLTISVVFGSLHSVRTMASESGVMARTKAASVVKGMRGSSTPSMSSKMMRRWESWYARMTVCGVKLAQ